METRLKEIIISLTNRCNLRCKMCQIPDIGGNGELTTTELKDLIRDAASLNPNSIVFSGGEPLLREDIFELIAFTNQFKINTCLTSNGVLVNEEVAKKLLASGIGVVNISIEGPEEIHDSLRGRGAFRKAITALNCLTKYKIESTIATVVLKQNYKFMDFVLNLAHQSGVTTVKFQPFSEIFLIDKSMGRGFFIPVDELQDVKEKIEKVIYSARLLKIATNPENYLQGIPLYLSGLQQKPQNYNCPALINTCPINAEGDVSLCWVLSNKKLGNIKKAQLSELWNSQLHQELRDSVKKEGCPVCLMSCYDYNFGNYNFWENVFLKTKKFKKPKFYKRLYYRIYQYVSYFFRKFKNLFFSVTSGLFNKLNKTPQNNNYTLELKEVKFAKGMLKKELKNLEKNGKG